jgi:integrase/recombinase XerD
MKNNRSGQAATLSNEEYSKIRKNICTEKYRILWDLAWYTGERWGALVQLKVSDVYDDAGKPRSEITFRAVTRKKSPDGNSETRQVPIHELLHEQLKHYKPDSNSIWLFPGKSDHMCWRNAYNIVIKAAEKAGLASKGVSTHSTRRSFVTNLHNNGVSLAVIKKITGHKDIKSLERYIDISTDQIKGAIATL